MQRVFTAVLLSLAAASHWMATCAGQIADPADAEKKFRAHAKEAAAAYEIRSESAAGRKLTLRPASILWWTNPVPERQMHGDVFLWTDDGRPAAVLCLFEMTENGKVRECHELCSLVPGPLVTIAAPTSQWSPKVGQVTMSPLPNAPLPATAPRQRLSQMRELAARFTCEKTTRMDETRTLRLLTQPLERYASPSHQVTDGALFAFVEATDPEIFLLVEMRAVNGTPQWHYGFARMASVHMRATLADKTIWEVETLPYDGYRNRPDQPYTTLFVR
jgi:hypothetical protein